MPQATYRSRYLVGPMLGPACERASVVLWEDAMILPEFAAVSGPHAGREGA